MKQKANSLVGIVDYSRYVPSARLNRDLIAEQWGSRSIGGAKSVANFDQDSLTLAFEAASTLVQRSGNKHAPDALYFASTTAPYWQRASSSFIAAACDLPDELETVDFAGTLRSGTNALRAALNAVAAGANQKTIVAVADVRDAAPESLEEQHWGDCAVALSIGRQNVIAELIAHASRSDDFLDEWRRDSDAHVSLLSSRYSTERGYVANAVAIAKQILDMAKLKPSDIARVALASPDGKAHNIVAKKLGFTPEQLVEVSIKDGGLTGSPMPLALLCEALDVAKPGDLILAIGYGDGADGFLFRVTDEQRKQSGSCGAAQPLSIPTYSQYRKRRDFNRTTTEEGGVISNVMYEKEERQNIRLHATRCPQCELVQFPPSTICVRCQNRGELEEIKMAREGSIFTLTKDYLYNSPVSPTVVAVIEVDDGARFYCQVTDCDPETIRIGQRVRLTLRRLRDGGRMHHYYWKCMPAC